MFLFAFQYDEAPSYSSSARGRNFAGLHQDTFISKIIQIAAN